MRCMLPATWMTLFSPVSLLQENQTGLLPKCTPLVREVSRTLPTVSVSGIVAEQSAPMVWLKLTRMWNDSTSLKIDNPPLTCSSECSLASVPSPATIGKISLCRVQQQRPQMCHFDGCTSADTGLQFSNYVMTAALSQCPDPHRPNRQLRRWVVLMAASLLRATAFTCISENESVCLSEWVFACLQVTRCLLDQHEPFASWSERC